ncbi:hypothetical protein [Streptosporangium roseum]|uniref:hypothetical protein n=1 Tax=Streptosporangium roseum TaxID=2001 RepID=UPI003324D436
MPQELLSSPEVGESSRPLGYFGYAQMVSPTRVEGLVLAEKALVVSALTAVPPVGAIVLWSVVEGQ